MIKEEIQKWWQHFFTAERRAEVKQSLDIARDKIADVEEKVNALTLRERVLVLLGSAVVLYFLWSTLVNVLFPGHDQIQQKMLAAEQQLKALSAQYGTLAKELARDPNLALNQKTNELKVINSEMRKKIIEQVEKMVSPREMVNIVKNIVDQTAGVTLVLLESAGSTPLFQPTPDDSGLQVYRHGLTVILEGDYFETLKFLETLENQQQKMLWTELSYQVLEYPNAKVKISIETLGLEEGWIGV